MGREEGNVVSASRLFNVLYFRHSFKHKDLSYKQLKGRNVIFMQLLFPLPQFSSIFALQNFVDVKSKDRIGANELHSR